MVVLAVAAIGALCAFASPALAKEPLKFGEFVASKVGQEVTPATPLAVSEWKEDEASVSSLKLGGTVFGFNKAEAKPEPEEPCEQGPKVTGTVTEEKSKSLLTNVTFRRCLSWTKSGAGYGWKASTFTLAIRFIANESAEVGNSEGGEEIVKEAVVKVKTANAQCKIVIPAQFVPAHSGEKPEKFWEAAEYTPETEEPVENWEKSKKLQEEYPLDYKQRLEIETTEKFKGIISYVDTREIHKGHGCVPVKGEENAHLVTDESSKWYGWTEHTDGHIYFEAEGLEVKGGQLTFVPPA